MPDLSLQFEKWKDALLAGAAPLVTFGRGQGTRIQITAPSIPELADRLTDGVALRFPQPALMTVDDAIWSEDGEEDGSVRKGDLEVAKWTVLELQRKLNRLLSNAQSSIQEQGVNTLYLALGMLHWRQADDALEPVSSPLVLVPVHLVKGKTGPFTLMALDEDLTDNAALRVKLRAFGAELPALFGPEEQDVAEPRLLTGTAVEEYLRRVEALFADRGWTVTREAWLSNFSFESLVLYRDITDHEQLYLDHPLIRWLAGGERPEQSEPGDLSDLDEVVNPTEVFPILDCDDSQLRVLVRARNGENLVVRGPPGTGKSQTIANLIAQNLRDQNRVLFVSRKVHALEVVYDQLKKEGLDDLCLELHSHRAGRGDVVQQLYRSLQRGPVDDSAETDGFDQLRDMRRPLNEYAAALKEKRGGVNRSAYETIGRLAKRQRLPYVQSPIDALAALRISVDDEKARIRPLQKLANYAEIFASPDAHPWCGAAVDIIGPVEHENLKRELKRTKDALERIEGAWATIEQLTGLSGPLLAGDISTAISTADHLSEAPELPKALVGTDERTVEQLLRRLEPVIERAVQMAAAREEFGVTFKEEVLAVELGEISERYENLYRPVAGVLPVRLLLSSYRRDIAALRSFMADGASQRYGKVRRALAACRSYKNHYAWLSEQVRLLQGENLCGEDASPETDWIAVRAAAQWFTELGALTGQGVQPRRLMESLTRDADGLRVATAGAGTDLRRGYEDLDPGLAALDACFPQGVEGTPLAQLQLERLRRKVGVCLDSMDSLSDWAGYMRALSECDRAGLESFIESAREQGVQAEQLVDAFVKSIGMAWLTAVYHEAPILGSFSASAHEGTRAQFCALDRNLRKEAVDRTLRSATAGRPGRETGGNEIRALTTAALAGRKPSLRSLFGRMPTLLPQLKPCLLMSPLSVASYLPANVFQFDLVIFDEASQIPPAEAVGAIVRGKQVIVAGDEWQLPPTSFWAAGLDGDGDGDGDGPLQRSILEEFMALESPAGREDLLWHYRSKHESLIAFSNHEFYDNRLITFPSPMSETENDLGVRFVNVHDGVYDRGASRTNLPEARVVADLVLEQVTKYPERTLGVVTTNSQQQETIERLIRKVRKDNPHLEDAFREDGNKPFFVKNLERVQGDERDTIIISFNFGPDRNGAVSRNFGAYSGEGGPRRLNVAVTRGKMQTIWVSSLMPDQLDGGGASVSTIQRYMQYAVDGGRLPADAAVALGEPESEFEEAVLARLKAAGLDVDCQIGVSRYRIDLGVRHPDRPQRYILGIECDGATFHGSSSARERDRLRQDVLEDMGWEIFRIWSPDWWQNPDRVVERIRSRVEALRTAEVRGILATARAEPTGSSGVHDNQQAPILSPTPRESQTAAGASQADGLRRKLMQALGAAWRQQTVPVPIQSDGVEAQLRAEGRDVVDKRASGGALWVVGGLELEERLTPLGFRFAGGGGRATGNRPAWYLSN